MRTILGHSRLVGGARLTPANVTRELLCCTLNTRYDDMGRNHILDLHHFPKTVVLIEREEE